MCVQSVDDRCVLQFTLVLAACCVLHRRTSRVIHRQELSQCSVSSRVFVPTWVRGGKNGGWTPGGGKTSGSSKPTARPPPWRGTRLRVPAGGGEGQAGQGAERGVGRSSRAGPARPAPRYRSLGAGRGPWSPPDAFRALGRSTRCSSRFRDREAGKDGRQCPGSEPGGPSEDGDGGRGPRRRCGFIRPTTMILPQVHLRKPCYDFYFLDREEYRHVVVFAGDKRTQFARAEKSKSPVKLHRIKRCVSSKGAEFDIQCGSSTEVSVVSELGFSFKDAPQNLKKTVAEVQAMAPRQQAADNSGVPGRVSCGA
ncbi:hypothetical protein E1301_Tti022007 [Triplophysa tibetana]|uniref:Uncharacterized protein n=1 Tax=Triplophysa tibetana TaxID=1572043 RepID=A0A5A9NFK8_9TELE|nr:hypothetical protein E1301_Tti022007 [Triplophysa tibetana]